MSAADRISLMAQAMHASDDVSEVTDSEGRVAHIERDPSYPGAKHIYLDPSPEGRAVHEQWRLPPTLERPSFYPEGVPFAANLHALVMDGEGRRIVSWRADTPPPLGAEDVETIRNSLPPELLKLMPSDGEIPPDPNERLPALRKAFKEMRDNFELEWPVFVTTQKPPDEVFLEAFDAMVEEIVAAGWIEQPPKKVRVATFRAASFVRGDRECHLRLTSPFGIGSLTLYEKTVGLQDTA